MQEALGECDAGRLDEEALIRSMLHVSVATAPYLDGATLLPLWQAPSLTACAERLSSRAAGWRALHRSVAARDANGMVRDAGAILAGIRGDGPEAAYATGAALTGLLASGHDAAARDLALSRAPAHPKASTPPWLEILLTRAVGPPPGV